jgi:hypothetical protein
MSRLPAPSRTSMVFGVTGIVLVTLLAAYLRLLEPLASTVLPMEDPWRHMGLTRERLWAGVVGPPETMHHYPPGLHALMAAVWVYTGADLYHLFLLGPTGAASIGVIGVAVLLWRHLGPLPATIGSLAYAIAPGFILMTSAMRPVMLDFVLTPFLLYVILEAVRGRLRWIPVVAVFPVFFIFAHPWFLGLLTATVLLFVLFVFLVPTSRPRTPSALLGHTALIAVFGVALGLNMTGLGGLTYDMNRLFPTFMRNELAPWIVMAASLLPFLVVLVFPRLRAWITKRRPQRTLTRLERSVMSLLILLTLFAVTLPALYQGLPLHVNPLVSYGWPILALAALGLLLLPFAPGPLQLLGAAFIALLYPLSLYEVFHLEWLPFRLSLFLGIGLVLLGAASIPIITTSIKSWSTRLAPWLHSNTQKNILHRSAVYALPALLVAAPIGGTLYAATPDNYGWYRIQEECETEAMQEVAHMLNEDPEALMLTGSWQSWLVVVAFTDDATRLWVGHWWMREYEWHYEKWLRQQADRTDSPLYLLVDPHTHDLVSNLTFLDDHPWQPHASWCPDEKGRPAVKVYSSGPIRENWDI